MKVTVPCDVTIQRFYRMYVDVDENTTLDDIRKAAIEQILEKQDDAMMLDPEIPDIEREDILSVWVDVDGTMECYEDD